MINVFLLVDAYNIPTSSL